MLANPNPNPNPNPKPKLKRRKRRRLPRPSLRQRPAQKRLKTRVEQRVRRKTSEGADGICNISRPVPAFLCTGSDKTRHWD